ncbi:MAG: hypothetical protein OER22_04605 [Gammaproteobacteria bacterium]|nr:hypothetical protein [Gammaproteobacteria bacterium]MDH3372301.1 hypothetical protein [Gammaproteobacteria bacterium]MDH3551876.1 hypothetical protein [Gammaproteobacteria bacterium]
MTTRISLLLAALCVAASGCAVNEVITAEETELIIAETPPDEAMLLDIGVVEFVGGIDADNDPEESGIYEEIRSAEVRYLPYHLKTTLQGTGHWGAVRVIPSRSAFTDVVIGGEIEESDGEFIELKITVDDSRGQHWYEKTYSTQTGISSYSENRDRRMDPYQKVFNDIANDLKEYVDALPPESIREVRQVTELKFFADMAPKAYGEHLNIDEEGKATIVRLPADNDPSVDRLRQIRERDRLVVDTLNEHYANFYYGIAIPYHSWRKTAREESINYRQVKRSAALQTLMGAVVIAGALAVDSNSSSYSKRQMQRSLQNIAIGEGFEAMMSGISRRNEAGMHRESIKELSESFGAEAAPMVVTVEGETRRLTGTAAAQYESWRRLLKEIYEAETGFVETADAVDPDPVRIAEPTG